MPDTTAFTVWAKIQTDCSWSSRASGNMCYSINEESETPHQDGGIRRTIQDSRSLHIYANIYLSMIWIHKSSCLAIVLGTRCLGTRTYSKSTNIYEQSRYEGTSPLGRWKDVGSGWILTQARRQGRVQSTPGEQANGRGEPQANSLQQTLALLLQSRPILLVQITNSIGAHLASHALVLFYFLVLHVTVLLYEKPGTCQEGNRSVSREIRHPDCQSESAAFCQVTPKLEISAKLTSGTELIFAHYTEKELDDQCHSKLPVLFPLFYRYVFLSAEDRWVNFKTCRMFLEGVLAKYNRISYSHPDLERTPTLLYKNI